MKKNKNIVSEDSNPAFLNEPTCEYGAFETCPVGEYDIPHDLIMKACELAKQSVEAGRTYTTEEAMRMINERLGWE